MEDENVYSATEDQRIFFSRWNMANLFFQRRPEVKFSQETGKTSLHWELKNIPSIEEQNAYRKTIHFSLYKAEKFSQ